MFEQIVAALAVAAIVITPLVLLALAALRYGVDSRESVGDRRPWLL